MHNIYIDMCVCSKMGRISVLKNVMIIMHIQMSKQYTLVKH